jgi:hypothetical protein
VSSQENRAAAYAIFPVNTHLDEVVLSLNSAGFESIDICVFLSPGHPIADGVRSMQAKSAECSAHAGLENAVSWLSTFGGVVIPGIGFFVGSRDYLHALTRCDFWPDRNGGEALENLGIPAEAAARYEQSVKRNASMVFVNCDDSAQSEWAREILRLLRAEEVASLGNFEGLEKASGGTGLPS